MNLLFPYLLINKSFSLDNDVAFMNKLFVASCCVLFEVFFCGFSNMKNVGREDICARFFGGFFLKYLALEVNSNL
jgi:hypothetical protein